MKFITALLLFILQAPVGNLLPDWRPGYLDIHAINSARGECTFFVLPDGTTMVVDAGEFYSHEPKAYGKVAPKPDAATRPYKVYADYIRHFLPSQSRDSIDYFVLTHYHMDHMGHTEKGFAKDKDGGYVLSGVTALYCEVPFRKVLDRSYPDYSEDIHTGGTSKDISFYSKFIDYCTKQRGMKAERFEAGGKNQISLAHNARKYRSFSVLNYAANGFALSRTADGETVVDCHADRENAMSCAFLISYGPFEYWTSGDNNWIELVRCTSSSIGHPIEAMKCHHHMSNPDSFNIENEVLKPQVIVTQSFYIREIQPHQEIIDSIGDSQDLFFTNIAPEMAAEKPELYSKAKTKDGHIVIRVGKGGKSFMVYQLDDTDPSYRVKAVFGPYRSK